MSSPHFDWRVWLSGLAAALVSGFAGGITAGFTAMGIDPSHFNLAQGLAPTLKLAGACGVVNAIIGAATYLKQSPIPPEEKT